MEAVEEIGVKKFAYEVLDFDDGQFFANENAVDEQEVFSTEEKEKVEVASEEQNEQIEKPEDEIPTPPSYSESELELAKKLAKEEGLKEGQELANKLHEEEVQKKEVKVQELVENIESEAARLQEDVANRFVQVENEIKEISAAVTDKILGEAENAKLEGDIEKFIVEALNKAKPYGDIKIYVSEGASSRIKGKFKKVEILEDAKLGPNDFKILWDNGYAERKVGEIAEQIKELVTPEQTEEVKAEEVQTVAEEADSEGHKELNAKNAEAQEEEVSQEVENNENNKIEEDKNE